MDTHKKLVNLHKIVLELSNKITEMCNDEAMYVGEEKHKEENEPKKFTSCRPNTEIEFTSGNTIKVNMDDLHELFEIFRR